MRALFFTQSSSLALFHDLMQRLREPLGLEQAGFFVADRRYYQQFQRRNPAFEGGHPVLKEWEIVQRARAGRPDLGRLRAYERELGDPTLWGSLVADRRVYLGPLCTVRQDYRLRFDHERMLRILEEGLVAVERLFDTVKPDVVFSFICVTFGDYLAYLFARARGIPLLNLRPTRIENYVTFAPTVFEPAEHIRAAYERELERREEDEWTREARRFVASARADGARYEGVIPVSRQAPKVKALREGLGPRALQFARDLYGFQFGALGKDNHLVHPLSVALHRRVYNPLRAAAVNRRFGPAYVTGERLPALDYVFFPLHTEPEISLLVQSRPYLNQIEVIRNLSHNLPVGQTLLVKEHPASIGKRPPGYYAKLLQIPNVRLADPGLGSKQLIEHAAAVANIAGSIGFEALLRGKPAITFGRTPYEMLPDTMVRRITSLESLGAELQALLAVHRYDEHALVSYVAATMRNSARVNLYSGLLGREGVYVPPTDSEAQDGESLAQLALRTLARHSELA